MGGLDQTEGGRLGQLLAVGVARVVSGDLEQHVLHEWEVALDEFGDLVTAQRAGGGDGVDALETVDGGPTWHSGHRVRLKRSWRAPVAGKSYWSAGQRTITGRSVDLGHRVVAATGTQRGNPKLRPVHLGCDQLHEEFPSSCPTALDRTCIDRNASNP